MFWSELCEILQFIHVKDVHVKVKDSKSALTPPLLSVLNNFLKSSVSKPIVIDDKGLFTNYVSQKWGVQKPLPPLSAIVSIFPTTPFPPLSANVSIFPTPSPSFVSYVSISLTPLPFRVTFVNIFNVTLLLNTQKI